MVGKQKSLIIFFAPPLAEGNAHLYLKVRFSRRRRLYPSPKSLVPCFQVREITARRHRSVATIQARQDRPNAVKEGVFIFLYVRVRACRGIKFIYVRTNT